MLVSPNTVARVAPAMLVSQNTGTLCTASDVCFYSYVEIVASFKVFLSLSTEVCMASMFVSQNTAVVSALVVFISANTALCFWCSSYQTVNDLLGVSVVRFTKQIYLHTFKSCMFSL